MKKLLLLSLVDLSRFRGYTAFLAEIESRAIVIKCTNKVAAFNLLVNNDISTVLVFEPSILHRDNFDIGSSLAKWTAHGGTTIFAAQCSVLPKLAGMMEFFETCFDIDWHPFSNHYDFQTFEANPDLRLELDVDEVPDIEIDAPSVLSNVARIDCVYVAEGENEEPDREDITISPIVFRNYSKGRLGWVGSKIDYKEEMPVVMAMLGL